MSKPPSENPRQAPGTDRVESTLGDITDSSTLFTVDKGRTYKDFWTNVSATWAGAAFAVVGTPFDEDPTPESTRLSGEPEVAIMAHALGITSESRVLEIGAGIGRLAVHMSEICGSYSGCDIAKPMLDIARQALPESDRVSFEELKEADPLPYPDASFDAVYSQAVMIHLDREDVYRYLREAVRVLRPGGRIWFQFYDLLSEEGFRIFEWVADNTVTPQGKVRGRVHFLTAPEVRAYFAGAAIEIDDAHSLLDEKTSFPYPPPTLNFDYYLVGVGRKPGSEARLANRDSMPAFETHSDAYYSHYLGAFYRKIERHDLADLLREISTFLKTLPVREAFEAVLELERGILGCQRAGVPLPGLLPDLRAAVNDDDATVSLAVRVRNRLQSAIARSS